MKLSKYILLFSTIGVLGKQSEIHAQAYPGTPIQQWGAFFSYQNPTVLATDSNTIFVGTNSGFFTYDKSSGNIEAYSTTKGMSDAGIKALCYDFNTDAVLLAYNNSNIDIFKNGKFYNLPDVKISSISGNKNIYNATARRGKAYLATGQGVMVINLDKVEISETIGLYENNELLQVNDVVFLGDLCVAATNAGVFSIDANSSSFYNYQYWNKITNEVFTQLKIVNTQLFGKNDQAIWKLENNSFTQIYTNAAGIRNIAASNTLNSIWVLVNGSSPVNPNSLGHFFLLDHNGNSSDFKEGEFVYQVLDFGPNDLWLGVRKQGLMKYLGENDFQDFTPAGPADYLAYDVYAYNKELHIAHGGHTVNFLPNYNTNYISSYIDDRWVNYRWVSNDDWMRDFVRITKNRNTGSVFATAYAGGLLEITKDQSLRTYAEGFLEPRLGEQPDRIYAYGMDWDKDDNLWFTNTGAYEPLKVRTKDGNIYSGLHIDNPLMNTNTVVKQNTYGDVIVDDNSYVWMLSNFETAGGLVVYDFNKTPTTNTDDRYRVLRIGENLGNLPSNDVLCIAKDKENDIWIGTSNGIAVVNCGTSIFEGCNAYRPKVQEDEFAGYFFQEQTVTAIAVDGANRKWIGTQDGGVWLVSESGDETIFRFNTNNSPLPSNNIIRINIDPVTGDVYFSTDMGLMCFRGTATDASPQIEKPLKVYPNPVPQDYNGMIAISGLTDNAEVTITDISGQLIYKTKYASNYRADKTNGGQVVWNGKDYKGKKAQTGVYLVLAKDTRTGEKASAKIIFRE